MWSATAAKRGKVSVSQQINKQIGIIYKVHFWFYAKKKKQVLE